MLITNGLLKRLMCEDFASLHGFSEEYVHAEFVNPDKATLDNVLEALLPFVVNKTTTTT